MSNQTDSVPVSWGVLGAARIATRQVIPAMQQSQKCRVVAIASRDGAKADHAASALGIPRAYGSYEQLLADPDVEAVYIPLPNHLHVPWSIRAAESGKHVLCEKPIGLSTDEAKELLEVRQRTGVLIGEAFMVRTHPQWKAVHALIAAGRIGELKVVTGHFSYSRRDLDDVRSHVEYGGGVLFDIGCYPVMLARWLFASEPLAVTAQIERDPERGVDRLTSGLLDFAQGQASFTTAGQLVPYQAMHFFGSTGRIQVEIPFNAPADRPCRLFVDDGRDLFGGGIDTIELPVVNQYTLQANAFSDAIRGRGDVPIPLEESIANMKVIDALFRSASTRRWEPIASTSR